MPNPAKRVAIVKEGEWGSKRQSAGDYDNQIENLVAWIDGIKDGEHQHARAEVIPSYAELLKKCETYPRPEVVIFNSRGILDKAEEFQRLYPQVRVMLFTGLVPDGHMLVLNKALMSRPDIIEALIRS